MDDVFGSDADFLSLAAAAEQTPSRPAPSRPNAASSTASTAANPDSASTSRKVTQPKPQALPRSGPSAILVSTRQRGNPILAHIHALPWEYSDTPADYVLGTTTCALFLSLKYHRLHPEYIYSRIKALGHKYNLRVLLAMVDIENHEDPLRELTKTSLVNDLTLILAWSAREAARYLEAYKTLEHTAPAAIRGTQASGYAERMIEFVTVPRGINKADAIGLVSAFGSLRGAIQARPEEVGLVQGWGDVKVKRWCSAVREPFRAAKATKRRGEDNDRRSNIIPLGRAPNLPSRASTDGTSTATPSRELPRDDISTRAASAVGASRGEAVNSARPTAEPDDVEDDLAEIQARSATMSSEAAREKGPKAPPLSSGIQTALARYRS